MSIAYDHTTATMLCLREAQHAFPLHTFQEKLEMT